MSNITDELRTYAKGYEVLVNHKLLAIADRIDAEHDEVRRFAENIENCARADADVTLFGVDYMPLPRDADGEPWHIGDELVSHDEVCEVCGIGDGTIYYVEGDSVEWAPSTRRARYHAPTLEDVLLEMYDRLDEPPKDDSRSIEEVIADYAAKVRELLGVSE